MNEIDKFLCDLKRSDIDTTYLCNEKEKEIDYMTISAYRFSKLLKRIELNIGLLRKTKPELKILDIGPTPFTIFLKNKFNKHKFCVLDRTTYLKNRFEQNRIEFSSCNLDQDKFPFEDGSFDIIIFTEVLEHIFAPPSEILKELNRILSSDGKLILSVPNIASIENRIKLLFGISPLENADIQLRKNWSHGHLHEYTRKEIIILCKRNKFKSTYCKMQMGIYKKSIFERTKHLFDFIFPCFRRYIYLELIR